MNPIAIFHGSDTTVDLPRVIQTNRRLDFGLGFYTTLNEAQAQDFARKVFIRRGRQGTPTVSQFTIDLDVIVHQDGLRVLEFSSPDEDWLDFVVSNRSNRANEQSSPTYDAVFGPVANDDVYRTVELYEDGDLTKAETIARLKVKELYNQIVFRTQSALDLLTYIGSYEVNS